MQRYIAFLRAINVGGHNVKMDRLRDLFAELGLANVETFIASGNVIFEADASDVPALEDRIERHLKQALGYEVATFVRSTQELAAVARYEPFPAAGAVTEGQTLSVVFVKVPLSEEARQRLPSLRTAVDEFHAHGREVYWLCRGRFSDSLIKPGQMEKAFGKMPGTARNVTTVRKLAAKYAGVQ